MIQIIPAILPKTHGELVEKFGQLSAAGYHGPVQVDVCDGEFVSSATVFFPFPKNEFLIEFDLMIDRPEETLDDYLALAPSRIVIHVESVSDWGKLGEMIADFPGEVGLSISNDTPIQKLESHLGIADFVQFMGITVIGLQGQEFDERVLDRMQNFQQNHPNIPISVDGAVSISTLGRLVDYGATRAVAGSAVFHDGRIMENLQKLQDI